MSTTRKRSENKPEKMVDPKSSALVDEMLSHLKADFADSDSSSRVAKLYANRSVFITGATGFIGKVLFYLSLSLFSSLLRLNS